MLLLKSSDLEFLNIILVSSANRIGLDFLLMGFDRSFMFRKKSKGPKIDPCGTPCFIIPQFENALGLKFLFFISILWYLFLSYNLIHSVALPVIP
jgi:hypothetical protein